VLPRSDEPSLVARSAAICRSHVPRETQLWEVQGHSSAVAHHSVDCQFHVVVDATCGTRHRNVLVLAVRYVTCVCASNGNPSMRDTSVALFYG